MYVKVIKEKKVTATLKTTLAITQLHSIVLYLNTGTIIQPSEWAKRQKENNLYISLSTAKHLLQLHKCTCIIVKYQNILLTTTPTSSSAQNTQKMEKKKNIFKRPEANFFSIQRKTICTWKIHPFFHFYVRLTCAFSQNEF